MREFQICQIWYDPTDQKLKKKTFIGLPPGNFKRFSQLNKMNLCGLFLNWMTTWPRPIFSSKKVRTSPICLGVRAFQSLATKDETIFCPGYKAIQMSLSCWCVLLYITSLMTFYWFQRGIKCARLQPKYIIFLEPVKKIRNFIHYMVKWWRCYIFYYSCKS